MDFVRSIRVRLAITLLRHRMTRFILTGAPGSGKTAIIRQLELDGFSIAEEAATDVIALKQAQGVAEPWRHPSFIDSIVEPQRRRQARASRQTDEIQFHDRSAICTAGLAVYLGYPPSDALSRELTRLDKEAVFQRRVFFIQNLGSSSRPNRGGSALRMRYVSNACMKKPIASTASSVSSSRRVACPTEWMRSSAPSPARMRPESPRLRPPPEADQQTGRPASRTGRRSPAGTFGRFHPRWRHRHR